MDTQIKGTYKLWATLISKNPKKHPDLQVYEDSNTIGREGAIQILIDDKRLSSKHAVLEKTGKQKCTITDLSRNGTFINNVKLAQDTPTILQQGDEICFLRQGPKVGPDEVITYTLSFTDPSLILEVPDQKLNAAAKDDAEDLSDDFKCEMCNDIAYQCVSLEPCNHNFCGACLTELIKNNKFKCPSCKKTATAVSKNKLANETIARFLAKNPEQQRQKEQYELMNKTNLLTCNRLELTKLKANKNKKDNDSSDLSCDSIDEELLKAEEKMDQEEEAEEQKEKEKAVLSQDKAAAAPVAPKSALLVERKDYIRPVILEKCAGCQADLKKDSFFECVVCDSQFCSSGSGRANRCPDAKLKTSDFVLKALEEFDAVPPVDATLFRDNRFQYEAFRKFMDRKGFEVTNEKIWENCQNVSLQAQNFQLDLGRKLNANAPQEKVVDLQLNSLVCNACFQRYVWFQVIFQYKRGNQINFPDSIQSRPDCHWGINCRTMVHNSDHAQKFNHMCQQIRY